jgi:hypothetical protein
MLQIEVLKSNGEKENDLVATGILPVIPNRQAGSLSHRPMSGVGCHCWLAQQCFLSSFSFLLNGVALLDKPALAPTC